MVTCNAPRYQFLNPVIIRVVTFPTYIMGERWILDISDIENPVEVDSLIRYRTTTALWESAARGAMT